MDLNKLRYFYIVAKHQHVTKAAQDLYISQPALTKAMQRLEEELGVSLFNKHRRGIRLTPYGIHLKKQLDPVFSILDRIPESLENLKADSKHTIRMNVLVASIITTDAIASYKKDHPQVNFQILQNKEASDCHISITVESPEIRLPPKHHQYVIPEDIFLAVPAHGQYAQQSAIDLKEVKNAQFICISNARPFRRLCDSFCLSAGFTPNVTFESDFPNAVRNLISAGAGVGFWPAFSFGQPTEEMKLLPVRSPQCQRKLLLSLHETATASRIVKDFYQYLYTYLQRESSAETNQPIQE